MSKRKQAARFLMVTAIYDPLCKREPKRMMLPIRSIKLIMVTERDGLFWLDAYTKSDMVSYAIEGYPTEGEADGAMGNLTNYLNGNM